MEVSYYIYNFHLIYVYNNCSPQYRRGLTEYPIGYNIPNWLFEVLNWGQFIQMGIGDLFADSPLPDSEIPNPRLGILFPIGDLMSPIEDIMPYWR